MSAVLPLRPSISRFRCGCTQRLMMVWLCRVRLSTVKRFGCGSIVLGHNLRCAWIYGRFDRGFWTQPKMQMLGSGHVVFAGRSIPVSRVCMWFCQLGSRCFPRPELRLAKTEFGMSRSRNGHNSFQPALWVISISRNRPATCCLSVWRLPAINHFAGQLGRAAANSG